MYTVQSYRDTCIYMFMFMFIKRKNGEGEFLVKQIPSPFLSMCAHIGLWDFDEASATSFKSSSVAAFNTLNNVNIITPYHVHE